ncbi:hypothetical protein CI109_101950 [Kwoniella shandongensis]|uniref:Thioredoxin domain-containing protein n=1 Tax=Kwoniella shandongensis TaxID=1734106 RepID=A0AAJ8LGP5_9TREE
MSLSTSSPSPPIIVDFSQPPTPTSNISVGRSKSLALPTSSSSTQTSYDLFPRSASISSATSNPSINSLRRLSRKLPPAWTESLEDLARTNSPSPSTSPSHSHSAIESQVEGISPRSKAIPLPTVGGAGTKNSKRGSEQFILSVAAPLDLALQHSPRSSTLTTAEVNSISSRSNSGSSFSQIFYNPSNNKSNTKPSTSGSGLQKRSVGKASISGPSSTTPARSLRPEMSPRKGSSSSSSNTSASSQILQTPTTTHASRFAARNNSVSATSSSCSSRDTCGTWSLLDEVQMEESIAAGGKGKNVKESRREKKMREKRDRERFDEKTPPTPKELFEASLLEVVGERGERVKFGDLVNRRKTIVIFIRHWFCPLCAQYMSSILSEVSVDALEKANVDLVIIGNGSDKMLDGYRNKSFRCPFKMYTDPTLALYRALGLTRQTGDSGPEEEKGDYLTQSALESTFQTIKRATKMPLLHNPGHFLQLGGEFVFDATTTRRAPLNVIYTHRMTNTRSHAPIRDICEEAGVRLEFIHYEPGPPPPPVHRASYISTTDSTTGGGGGEVDVIRRGSKETDEWKVERDETLSRMRALKIARREGIKALDNEGYTFDKRSKVGTDNVRIVGKDVMVAEEEAEVEGLGFAI